MRAARISGASGVVRVHVAPNGLPTVRVGLATAGVRDAVERNRLRRRLREALRPQRGWLAGLDVVISAGSRVPEPPYSVLCADLERALTQAAMRAGKPDAPAPAGGRVR